MKKYLIVFTFILSIFLGACLGKEESSELTMQSFIDAYEKAGVTINPDEKPIFRLIGALDGVIFYMDDQPVKIYEYTTVEEIAKGIGALPAVSEWEKNDRFVLETTNEKAIDIFKNVK